MKLFASLAAIGSLTLLCLAGPAFAQDEARDLEKMQGNWILETGQDKGQALPVEIKARLKFTIRGNQLIPSDNPKDFLTFKLDPSKDPPAIDLTEKDMKQSPGIYKFEDNTLKLCFVEGGTRPTNFSSTKDNKAVLLVLKRDKK